MSRRNRCSTLTAPVPRNSLLMDIGWRTLTTLQARFMSLRFRGRADGARVTSEGGSEPRWRGDGQELFYVADDLMITSVLLHESVNDFRVLSSRPLFRMQFYANEKNYDVTRNGQQFLMTYRTHKEQAAPVAVITNWTAGLQNRSSKN